MKIRRLMRRLVERVASWVAPSRWKQHHELQYWKRTKAASGTLTNSHYEWFYTTHFRLGHDDFAGKVLVDIGCGPRGSLEWAGVAARRIGVDPLAAAYRALGADRHAMEYLEAGAERIPLATGLGDFVFSFNSLDHVDDVGLAIREIKRITRPAGRFLLIVEINHPPSPTEPHELKCADLLDQLGPEFVAEEVRVFKQSAPGVYDSIRAGVTLPLETPEPAWLSASLRRRT